MSKALAKKLKETLELDAEPTPALLVLAKGPDGPVKAGKYPKQLLKATTPKSLQGVVQKAIITHSVGDVLARAREESHLSLAQVAQKVKATRGRVAQVEHPDARLEIQTLVRYADAMGYDVAITLKPKASGKKALVAELR
jgi:ribosome-binding protein aMBF1 (putative translation factor)